MAEQNVTVTVAKKSVTVTALDKSAYTGSTAPDLSSPKADKDYKVEGLVGADTLSGTVTLDVYKRQVQSHSIQINTRKIPFHHSGVAGSVFRIAFQIIRGAVSYTHVGITCKKEHPSVISSRNASAAFWKKAGITGMERSLLNEREMCIRDSDNPARPGGFEHRRKDGRRF